MTEKNQLYFGDNLEVLRLHVADASVDLVYLDPPFNSNANYNVLFKEHDGAQAASQIQAFEDTWKWDEHAARAYQETVETGGKLSETLQAFRKLVGESDMLAYLSMMAPRLQELRRVLKPTGSIYLHCDPTASHYLKLLMDAVFGAANFRNEIIWRRTGSHNSSKRYGPIHDTLFFYSRSDEYLFKRVFRPYLKGHVDAYFRKEDSVGKYWTNALTGAGTRKGDSGKPWRNYNPTDSGRHWAIPGKVLDRLEIDSPLTIQQKLDALDEAGLIDHPAEGSKSLPTYRQYLQRSPGMPLQDIWAYQPYTKGLLVDNEEGIDEDVRWFVAQGDRERLGYPTQKPVGLVARIIEASSKEGDVVLDPFCGCGTTIDAAQKLGRRWIGIDITHLAINLIRHRLRDSHYERPDADTYVQIEDTYEVIGEPTSVPDARVLAEQDPYQFQWWALGLVGARPAEGKKGADKGIDGRLYFHDDQGGKTKQVIFSVKAGKTQVSHVRDLCHVVDREKAQMGVLISMHANTKPMRAEAADMGFYESPWGKHAKVQLLTVSELLEGKGVDMPPATGVNVTFKKAPKKKGGGDKQMDLSEEEE